jgi:hypothetical protein
LGGAGALVGSGGGSAMGARRVINNG